MVIAIDGPAGAGKSTVARAVAQRLGFTYLDSGALYRCAALAALRCGWTVTAGRHGPPDAPAGRRGPSLAELAGAANVDLGERILLDGLDVTEEIRAPEVSEMASRVATDPDVRTALVDKQRELLAGGDWVAEGRDIGTVVAPGAELKIFLTADPRERARRRAAELGADAETVLAEQTLRDERDTKRSHSPLALAPGAVELDTSGLQVEQVVECIAALARGAKREA